MYTIRRDNAQKPLANPFHGLFTSMDLAQKAAVALYQFPAGSWQVAGPVPADMVVN